jgi:hypothetical protein
MPSKQVTIQGVMTWDESGPNYPSQGPGFPTNPIAPGGTTPPWGVNLPLYPSHPIAPGGQPPYPSQGPGFPTNPIAPGGTTPPWGINLPPSIWPSPGRPDNSLPPVLGLWPDAGVPTHPIVLPPPFAPPGSAPIQPIAGMPVGDNFIAFNVPGYGWMLVYTGGENRPDNTLPVPESK